MRRFAIGDIHGCSKALRTLIETIDPQPNDELVFLGDYVDRGPDSRDVVDQVIALRDRCRVVALRGNHEIMLMGVALGGLNDSVWLNNGGKATVSSYGGCLTKIPPQHLSFFQDLAPFHESPDSIFVHAGYDHRLGMHEQTEATTYWNHISFPLPPAHTSGKRVFVGHTPQSRGEILDADHFVCIDTCCFGGGFLTAYETIGNELIQTDIHGHVRRESVLPSADRLRRLGRSVVNYCRGQVRRTPARKDDSQTTVNLVGESADS